ncbi:MAG: TerB N-terminal domain-containing protein [Spirochaetaceae bacterium]|jgi:hypothetical protein|nr:TerB N-terminal domain-containing protein [Spirochaetaceae bacterium]
MTQEDTDDLFLFDTGEIETIVSQSRAARIRQNGTPSWARGSAHHAAFTIPAPEKLDYRWIKPSERVTISASSVIEIECGLFYYGTSMMLVNNVPEASLLNPELPLSSSAGADSASTPPPEICAYAQLNPLQRGIYAAWLAGGRSDPDVPGWAVKLFLMGVERRFIEDARRGLVTGEEQRIIRDETARLCRLYEPRHDVTARELSEFYQYTALCVHGHACSSGFIPPMPVHEGYSAYMYVMLDEFSRNNKPLSAELAFAIYCCEKSFPKSPAFFSCRTEFKTLFLTAFNAELAGKIRLTPGNPLKITNPCYKPLSSTVRTVQIPLRPALKKFLIEEDALCALTAIAEQCAASLNRYAEFCTQAAAGNERIHFIKPFFFWDEDNQKKALLLRKTLANNAYVYRDVEWLLAHFNVQDQFSPELFFDIAAVLEEQNIGSAPNFAVVSAELTRKTPLFLFFFPGPRPMKQQHEPFFNLLRLCAAAITECYSSDVEVLYPDVIKDADDYTCLKMKYTFFWLCKNPPSFNEAVKPFKKENESLRRESIDCIAAIFKAYQHKGVYDSGYKTIMFLEKLYQAFKIKTEELYRNLHNEAAGSSIPNVQKFALDKQKIKSLRKDTEHVSKLLSGIFAEDSPPPVPKAGLDIAHRALLKTLLSQDQWTREAASAAAAQHKLSLDGAVEIINEAFFEFFGAALIEESDTYLVNTEIRGKLCAHGKFI